MQTIRYSEDAKICVVDDGEGNFSTPTQREMDTLELGADLTEDEIDSLDE